MDLYHILGVPKKASQDVIAKAYRQKAVKMHPDMGGDPDAFKLLAFAYEVLGDEEARKRYDETGQTDKPGNNQAISDAIKFFHDALFRIISQGLDVETKDILGMAHREIQAAREGINKEIENVQRNINGLKKALKRLRIKNAKDDGPDYLGDSIKSLMAEMEKSLNQSDLDKERLAAAEKILQRYAYEFSKGGVKSADPGVFMEFNVRNRWT
jgi:curved DNA-binding protein CbpA